MKQSNNENRPGFITEIWAKLEEAGMSDQVLFSSGRHNQLYLQLPYRGHELCIAPFDKNLGSSDRYISLFFTDWIDDLQEANVLLDAINQKLRVKGYYELKHLLRLHYERQTVVDDVMQIINATKE